MKTIIEYLNDELMLITYYQTDKGILPEKINQVKLSLKDSGVDIEPKDDIIAVSRLNYLRYFTKNINDSKRENLVENMYSYTDYKRGITWCEVAYLHYYVLNNKRTMDWNTIKPEKGLGISVRKEEKDGVSCLNERLCDYISTSSMEDYISSMIVGRRYIPLPLYCAFIDFVTDKGEELDISTDMMFKKISKKDCKSLMSLYNVNIKM